MKSWHLVLASVLMMAGSFATSGSVLYDVDFENPPHTNGSPVTAGPGSDRPLGGQNFVVSNLTLFGSQTAVVNADGLFAWMSFNNAGSYYTSGVHLIQWDWALLSPDGATDPQTSVIIGNGGSYVALTYQRDGFISAFDAEGTTNAGVYVPGTAYNYQVVLDLDASRYSFWIDGQEAVTNRSYPAGSSFEYLRFYRPFGSPSYAVDNFYWEIIPEPSTFLLVVVGLPIAAVAALRSRRRSS